jgi:peptidylprolyl isomerase
MTRKPVRLIATAVIVGLAAAAVAAACYTSSDGGAEPSAAVTDSASPSAADDATEPAEGSESAEATATAGPPAADVLESVQWDGEDANGVPVVTFTTPLAADGSGARVVAEGTGEELTEGSLVGFDYEMYEGTDGSAAGGSYDGLQPAGGFQLATGSIEENLYAALVGQKVGVKVLYLVQGLSSDGSPGVIALAVNAVSTPLARAEGTEVTDIPDTLPVITRDATGKPSMTPVTGAAPSELVVQPLIEGDGPALEENQNVSFHYDGWLWDGTEFDNSWDSGSPFVAALSSGQLIDGWVQGLVGQKVGSQVLLIVPPELGYGDTEQGEIPANSTLVFVVDILGAV